MEESSKQAAVPRRAEICPQLLEVGTSRSREHCFLDILGSTLSIVLQYNPRKMTVCASTS